MARDRRPAPKDSRRALSRVDGPRGVRDGKSVEQARERRQRTVKRLGIGAAVLLLVACVGLVVSSPWRSGQDQRAEESRAVAERDDVRAELTATKRKVAEATTDVAIERRAREELGWVMPGEEAFAVVPAPVDPAGLPDAWPFTGVEQAIAAG
ncbi:MAG: septum formation initiator family protein [Acidimicrobiales bacterium]|nr:septum formation initiator family protein [Acidimicrobiales bacterium]